MFEFSETTKDRIEILNSVLNNLGQASILENESFEIDHSSTRSHLLIARIAKVGSCPLIFYFEEDSIRIDICEINEAFEFDAQEIDNARESVIAFVKSLLTSFVLIEFSKSPHWRSRMYLFDSQGVCVLKRKIRGLFDVFSEWDFERHLYFPIWQDSV